jgi:hypothetical protein
MWCRWEDIQHNNNLDKYIAKMEAVLAKFAAMGLDLPPQILSCAIIARISKKRPTMMESTARKTCSTACSWHARNSSFTQVKRLMRSDCASCTVTAHPSLQQLRT